MPFFWPAPCPFFRLWETLKFICNCGMRKDWVGPFFPPSKIFWSFYWLVSLSVYVTHSLYLNTYEWPIPKRQSSFQTKHFICTATLCAGERLGRPILSPPPLQNVLIFLFIFQSFSLCYSFTVSEDLWMTHSKEIIKFSNQKVYWLSPSKVFQPLYFILVNWFFQIVGWGRLGWFSFNPFN